MRLIQCFLFLVFCVETYGQSALKKIREKEIRQWITVLASDSLEGRRVFTPGIDKAARFLNEEFRKTGLRPMNGQPDFYQRFGMFTYLPHESKVIVNGKTIEPNQYAILGNREMIKWDNPPGKIVYLNKKETFSRDLSKQLQDSADLLVVLDTSLFKQASRLQRFSPPRFEGGGNVLILFSADTVKNLTLEAKGFLKSSPLTNIVGQLPGKSKPNEYLIFSAHFDHLGHGTAVEGDSIYNGANDDASGVTAVLALARYFSSFRKQERTILFVAFTGEESGGYGSRYFARTVDPDLVKAMFNIEMIGTESRWGKNSAYITGYENSNFGSLLQSNLKGTTYSFYPDPYPQQKLFYRSDNATLARLGVPAHTISTSKMDSEKLYHTVNDEVGTLDLKNMTDIIRAIALSSLPIVMGNQTPSRVDTEAIR